ncbi:MAG: hypothetical protein HYT88_03875, partial [Candidatus Omnitrophica bacterium]|nr:hypothetical protein [Candidatus Omnitrophota bacterium]
MQRLPTRRIPVFGLLVSPLLVGIVMSFVTQLIALTTRRELLTYAVLPGILAGVNIILPAWNDTSLMWSAATLLWVVVAAALRRHAELGHSRGVFEIRDSLGVAFTSSSKTLEGRLQASLIPKLNVAATTQEIHRLLQQPRQLQPLIVDVLARIEEGRAVKQELFQYSNPLQQEAEKTELLAAVNKAMAVLGVGANNLRRPVNDQRLILQNQRKTADAAFREVRLKEVLRAAFFALVFGIAFSVLSGVAVSFVVEQAGWSEWANALGSRLAPSPAEAPVSATAHLAGAVDSVTAPTDSFAGQAVSTPSHPVFSAAQSAEITPTEPPVVESQPGIMGPAEAPEGYQPIEPPQPPTITEQTMTLDHLLGKYDQPVNGDALRQALIANGLTEEQASALIQQLSPDGQTFDRAALVRELTTSSDSTIINALQEYFTENYFPENAEQQVSQFIPGQLSQTVEWGEPAFIKALWETSGFQDALAEKAGVTDFEAFKSAFEAQMAQTDEGRWSLYDTLRDLLGGHRGAKA